MIVKVVDPKSAEGAGDIDSVKQNESPIVGNALQPEAARATQARFSAAAHASWS